MTVLYRALALALCLTLARAVVADDFSKEVEKSIGDAVSWSLKNSEGVDSDPLLARWVQQIGLTVSAASPRQELPYSFTILGTDVANAQAVPGASIFVTRGLLDTVESDDELAVILAHETGHVTKRHAWQQITGTIFALLLLSQIKDRNVQQIAFYYNVLRTLHKSREMEAQADEEGLKFAFETGYDAGGLVHFFDGFDQKKRSPLEEYFATHPAPEKRIASARRSPYVALYDSVLRERTAEGYEARDLSGAAAVVRRGGDPLVLPPAPPLPPLPDYIEADRKRVQEQSEALRKGLNAPYRIGQVGNILQTLLLVNERADLRWLFIASQAYSVQARVEDLYERTLRVAQTAPATYDALARSAQRPPGDPVGIESSLGRAEVLRALAKAQGVPTPIKRAATAVTTVLVDLNNRFYRLRGDADWLRYGALEGLLQYAESELSRADKTSGQAWRILSMARVRRYQARLDELIPEDNPGRRALWNELAARRFGIWVPAAGPTGEASVRSALALETGVSPMALDAARNDTFWADYILKKKGVPENIATALRLLTLDLERETAEQYRNGQ